jgi:hypothetical protein
MVKKSRRSGTLYPSIDLCDTNVRYLLTSLQNYGDRSILSL